VCFYGIEIGGEARVGLGDLFQQRQSFHRREEGSLSRDKRREGGWKSGVLKKKPGVLLEGRKKAKTRGTIPKRTGVAGKGKPQFLRRRGQVRSSFRGGKKNGCGP